MLYSRLGAQFLKFNENEKIHFSVKFKDFTFDRDNIV